MSRELDALINVPHLRFLGKEGGYWADGWITQELHLSCEAIDDLSGLNVSIWNPDSALKYAGNLVTVACNQWKSVTEPLAMGERVDVHLPIVVHGGDELEISVFSSNVMKQDALDTRERGVILVSISAIPDKKDVG
jgi:hypothetical protein